MRIPFPFFPLPPLKVRFSRNEPRHAVTSCIAGLLRQPPHPLVQAVQTHEENKRASARWRSCNSKGVSREGSADENELAERDHERREALKGETGGGIVRSTPSSALPLRAKILRHEIYDLSVRKFAII